MKSVQHLIKLVHGINPLSTKSAAPAGRSSPCDSVESAPTGGIRSEAYISGACPAVWQAGPFLLPRPYKTASAALSTKTQADASTPSAALAHSSISDISIRCPMNLICVSFLPAKSRDPFFHTPRSPVRYIGSRNREFSGFCTKTWAEELPDDCSSPATGSFPSHRSHRSALPPGQARRCRAGIHRSWQTACRSGPPAAPRPRSAQYGKYSCR